MPQMIILMLIKKYLFKILSTGALIITGVGLSIYLLDGWSAFFASIGVIFAGILILPLVIILGLVKMLNIGKEFNLLWRRKISKQEFFMSAAQAFGMYMMGQEMSKVLGSMSLMSQKSMEDNNVNSAGSVTTNALMPGLMGSASLTTIGSSDPIQNNDNDDFAGMPQMDAELLATLFGDENENLSEEELQNRLLQTMSLMFGGIEGSQTTNIEGEVLKNKDKNDISDVEIKN